MKGMSGEASCKNLECYLCGVSHRVDYHGRRPPFCRQLVFMEDVFCMRDPFAAGGGEGGDNVRARPSLPFRIR